jgi:hypothetical protein
VEGVEDCSGRRLVEVGLDEHREPRRVRQEDEQHVRRLLEQQPKKARSSPGMARKNTRRPLRSPVEKDVVGVAPVSRSAAYSVRLLSRPASS